MKEALNSRGAPWLGALLVLAAALTLAACDNDLNVTGPRFPEFPPANGGSVWVTGTLTSATAGAGCLEARLLYDGQHIGRSYCDDRAGCAELTLQGFKERRTGRHTVELQVVRQSPAEVVYRAQVELRHGPSGPPYQSLGPIRRTLRAGESVTFEIDIP